MTQAQADLEHLRTAKIEVIRKSSETLNRPVENDKSEDTAGKGTEKKVESSANIAADHSSTVLPPSANAFLSRLTSSTSHLQNSIRQTFQSTLASASSNPAIANSSQLRAQLAENLRLSSATENLQVSMKQAEKLAEEYLRKGDQWVKDAEQWMGDAVKVVPPEGEETRHVGMSWDGSDWYSFSTSSKTPLGQFRQEGAEYAASARPARISMSGAGLAGSRKEALLRRLREDKELLMVDPSGEAESGERRDKFRKWVSDDWRRVKEDEREQQEGYVGGIRMALGES